MSKKKNKTKKAFYGIRTKKRVIEDYFSSSASMKELSEIHGIMGSNTVSNWLRKYGNLRPSKFSNTPIMSKPHASEFDKTNRKNRYKTALQINLSELEIDPQTAQQRLRFYSTAYNCSNTCFSLRSLGSYSFFRSSNSEANSLLTAPR